MTEMPPAAEEAVVAADPELLPSEAVRAYDEDPTGRLGRYLDRTESALDLLALLTMWVVVLPVLDLFDHYGMRSFGWVFRVGLSVVFGIDMAIRATLARRHLRYLLSHKVGVLAVVFPPVRILFSLRLIRLVFRRGNLERFLFAASVLMLNLALIVYFLERDAAGANIDTLRDAIWWALVTVTTVGYGDYYPVTFGGQVSAVGIMAIGIVTLAVVTAQVSSLFVEQSARARADAQAADAAAATADAPPPPAPPVAATSAPPAPAPARSPSPSLAELEARLVRIEAMLAALGPGDPDPAPDGPPA